MAAEANNTEPVGWPGAMWLLQTTRCQSLLSLNTGLRIWTKEGRIKILWATSLPDNNATGLLLHIGNCQMRIQN
jgi:hypothetical protein